MNIQKEVEKFEKKKAKLTTNFILKLSKYVSGMVEYNKQIDQTIDSLRREKASNYVSIEKARKAIKESK